ncbi:hypothetical protein F6X40_11335 [Paraburkholderia sp. UCT31]|uniref:hypothetical protein n=1 Tax=Paraburkholderia sp. UCT31 TaxID=2615209 RepID=UPI0016558971|nr:hypothetical protein [Paraburkholderia sp. UCT31]MBC8737397.1 hypothetical protein [Paraburkholderia sp. UCT31]
MGTCINYEIGSIPSVILFSNSSHETESPEEFFRAAVERTGNFQTTLTLALLQAAYTTDSANGRHRAGEPMFSVDLYPGYSEKVLRVNYRTNDRPVIEVRKG